MNISYNRVIILLKRTLLICTNKEILGRNTSNVFTLSIDLSSINEDVCPINTQIVKVIREATSFIIGFPRLLTAKDIKYNISKTNRLPIFAIRMTN